MSVVRAGFVSVLVEADRLLFEDNQTVEVAVRMSATGRIR